MRFPRALERDVLQQVRDDPRAHLFFGATPQPVPGQPPYQRSDGAIAVNREGLQELLHRRLFRIVTSTDLGRRKLVRLCDAWGCQNPFHYRLARGLEPRSRDYCPNGHAYTVANTTASGHCRLCAQRRRARRAPGLAPDAAALNAAKRFCPAGHEYDVANTYLYEDERGTHRKCRACNAERARRRRSTTG